MLTFGPNQFGKYANWCFECSVGLYFLLRLFLGHTNNIRSCYSHFASQQRKRESEKSAATIELHYCTKNGNIL